MRMLTIYTVIFVWVCSVSNSHIYVKPFFPDSKPLYEILYSTCTISWGFSCYTLVVFHQSLIICKSFLQSYFHLINGYLIWLPSLTIPSENQHSNDQRFNKSLFSQIKRSENGFERSGYTVYKWTMLGLYAKLSWYAVTRRPWWYPPFTAFIAHLKTKHINLSFTCLGNIGSTFHFNKNTSRNNCQPSRYQLS